MTRGELGVAAKGMARVVVQAAIAHGLTRERFLEFCGRLWDELAASNHHATDDDAEQDQA